MYKLDRLDEVILDILQNDFPLSVEPYQDIAKKIAISEQEVLKRIKEMKNSGIIRRIGGVMDSQKMGYYSTLCAIKVPEERIDEAAAYINSFDGVTHNYLRDYEWNMWFTLTAESQACSANMLRQIEQNLGLQVISMPAIEVYKIKVSFDVRNRHDI